MKHCGLAECGTRLGCAYPGEGICPIENETVEIYSDARVMKELERLSQHTSDETQSRIQAVYMWMREQSEPAPGSHPKRRNGT